MGVLAYAGPYTSRSNHLFSDEVYWGAGEKLRFASVKPGRKKFRAPNRYLVRSKGGWWYSPASISDIKGTPLDAGSIADKDGQMRSKATPEPTKAMKAAALVEKEAKKAREEQPVAPMPPMLRQLAVLDTDGKDGPINVQIDHELVAARCARRNVNLALPPLALCVGQALTIKRMTGGAKNKVIIKANGKDLIDGNKSFTLHEPWQWVTIYALADRWVSIG